MAATVDKKSLLGDEKLQAAFHYLDEDKTGKVSVSNLKKVLGKSVHCTDKVWAGILKDVDLDGDGEIDFKEFKFMM